MKHLCYALMLFCVAYLVRAEWLVYQHYLLINRDFYPIMSDFYRMYAERAAACAGQLSCIALGLRSQQIARLTAQPN